jgi:hypothetical protein
MKIMENELENIAEPAVAAAAQLVSVRMVR